MSALDFDRLRAGEVSTAPFEHLIVPEFVRTSHIEDVTRDFPNIAGPGSYPAREAIGGPTFNNLLEDLRGNEITDILSEKFDLDLASHPIMTTLRGQCRTNDGKIHVDSKGKMITMLIYLNPVWDADGGRLRLLRSPTNIDDYETELPPNAGTMLVFRCTPDAWHGHKPFSGTRRTIQQNWVVNRAYLRREMARHRVSAFLKGLTGKSNATGDGDQPNVSQI
jgi:hypothetical protein